MLTKRTRRASIFLLITRKFDRKISKDAMKQYMSRRHRKKPHTGPFGKYSKYWWKPGINICSTTGTQQRRTTVARSRYPSMQQRQYRLRSYGVSTAHGDGQMLLPINNNNSSQSNSNQSSSEAPMATSNLTHRHTNSSQQNSTASEFQSRRVPTSISITTSTSTSTFTLTTTNNHQRSHLPGLQNQ